MIRIIDLNTHGNRARKDDMSRMTASFLTRAHSTLKIKGFERIEDSRQSAMFMKVYVRGDHRIALNGWHGTGTKGTCRNYGDLKLIFSLYDNKMPKAEETRWKADFDLDLEAPDTEIEKFIREIEKHINSL